MKRVFALCAIGAALALPALPATAQDAGVEQTAKITDKDHPDFVKCRTERVIGSLAKRKKTCLTNRQWEEFARRGNENARRTVEENAAGLAGN
ncbi:hypothetical protein P8Q88_12895 [Qipengyuania sp. XHP0207]|uniref:hypothetical protein n=1 Tax=Qipengyuania sp. XHP0207 TaxID=3038078 RepID=UPI00241E2ADE|nr:hypothetical protein [Qipengyuania sp. XHP0207]MDG5749074.1 hypothetical protein [Qipengyuania sp. XHP0207]